MTWSREKEERSPVKTEESLHLLPRLGVELLAPRPTRSHTRPSEREEHILVQRPRSVLLDQSEIGRAEVVTEDGVGRLGGP
jgi:hypothetical protein